MASELTVQTIKAPTSGGNANKILVTTGQKIVATDGGSLVSPGGILQVKQGFLSVPSTLSSASFTNISGLSVDITPYFSTSKFFIIFDLSMTLYGYTGQTRIMRDSTAIGIAASSNSRTQTTTSQRFDSTDANHSGAKLVGHFLDSPSTTSQITYQIQGKTQTSQPSYINRTGNDANNGDWSARQVSTITVMEVAG